MCFFPKLIGLLELLICWLKLGPFFCVSSQNFQQTYKLGLFVLFLQILKMISRVLILINSPEFSMNLRICTRKVTLLLIVLAMINHVEKTVFLFGLDIIFLQFRSLGSKLQMLRRFWILQTPCCHLSSLSLLMGFLRLSLLMLWSMGFVFFRE